LGEILCFCWVSVELKTLPPSKQPGGDQAESSDTVNVLNIKVVFLEDAGDIHIAKLAQYSGQQSLL
jgi:hypothetical protein